MTSSTQHSSSLEIPVAILGQNLCMWEKGEYAHEFLSTWKENRLSKRVTSIMLVSISISCGVSTVLTASTWNCYATLWREELNLSGEGSGLCPHSAPGGRSLGLWDALPGRSVFVCVEAWATGQSNDVIYNRGSGICHRGSKLQRNWRLKVLALTFREGLETKGWPHMQCDRTLVKTLATKGLGKCGNFLYVLSKGENAILDSMEMSGSSVFRSRLVSVLWVSSFDWWLLISLPCNKCDHAYNSFQWVLWLFPVNHPIWQWPWEPLNLQPAGLKRWWSWGLLNTGVTRDSNLTGTVPSGVRFA